MDSLATVLGYGLMVCASGIAMVMALMFVFWCLRFAGERTFKRLLRVYHLSVITYWLDRLEKEGQRCFQKALDEDKKKMAAFREDPD